MNTTNQNDYCIICGKQIRNDLTPSGQCINPNSTDYLEQVSSQGYCQGHRELKPPVNRKHRRSLKRKLRSNHESTRKIL